MMRHTVGVMGSGTDEHEDLAGELGRLLARRGVNLLTGGGPGVMRSVSRAFVESRVADRGVCIGILPCWKKDAPAVPRRGYPNEYVELPIYTHLPLSGQRGREPLSRNHINILSSDAIVALPGAAGTASEIALAVTYGRPILLYGNHPAIAAGATDVPRAFALSEVTDFLDGCLVRPPGARHGTAQHGGTARRHLTRSR